MLLFLKGIIVGIGKIIPGVSGALLAINLNVYERLINSLTSFFDNPKTNAKFLLLFGIGLLSSIVLTSNIIIHLFNNYKFITMTFFLGLIIGGTYIFAKEIKYNKKNILSIFLFCLLVLILISSNINYHFQLKNNVFIYFIGGYIEIIASIIPGISATSLLMMLGIYDNILQMVANSFTIDYVSDNIILYISYISGMLISFIINIYLIKYLINKYRNNTYIGILCLSIMSIILLLINTLNINYGLNELIMGIFLLISGIIISKKLSNV